MQNFVVAFEGESVLKTPLGYALYGIELQSTEEGELTRQ
jgi:hypothetical protein